MLITLGELSGGVVEEKKGCGDKVKDLVLYLNWGNISVNVH